MWFGKIVALPTSYASLGVPQIHIHDLGAVTTKLHLYQDSIIVGMRPYHLLRIYIYMYVSPQTGLRKKGRVGRQNKRSEYH